jgi:hypothetical protein
VKPAPRAGGWCKIERMLEWKRVKEVKEIEQSVVKHNASLFLVLTLFEEGP